MKVTLGQLKHLWFDKTSSDEMNIFLDTYLKVERGNFDTHEISIPEYKVKELLRLANNEQKALLRQWGIIDIEQKFKEGDYIIHTSDGFSQITKVIEDGLNFKGVNCKHFHYKSQQKATYFTSTSYAYNNSRLATLEEIEANTLIKLEVGSYIYHPDFGVGGNICVRKVIAVCGEVYHAVNKHGYSTCIHHGSQFHKQLKLATPEQIKDFNCPWNEGIEEAKKYKDGQPCLVRDKSGYLPRWELRYANGKGQFYPFGKKDGTPINFIFHMPLNETTVKNLPVNE